MKRRSIVIFVLFGVFCSCLPAVDKKEAIKKIQVFGERNSGTNYLQKILQINFPHIRLFFWGQRGSYGFKHWPAWHTHSLVLNRKIFLSKAERFYCYPDSDDCLFVLIVRNPYDWLKSMKNRPYEIKNRKSFWDFIIKPVEFKHTRPKGFPAGSISPELNPRTLRHFENIMQLRSAKLQNYLLIFKKVKNCMIVRYEDLCARPFDFLKNIAQYLYDKATDYPDFVPYHLEARSWLKKKRVSRKKYTDYTQAELNFINQELDWDLEKIFGYSQVDHPDQL